MSTHYVGETTFYISLITDAYSHKIVGYYLFENMKTGQTMKTLNSVLNLHFETFYISFLFEGYIAFDIEIICTFAKSFVRIK